MKSSNSVHAVALRGAAALLLILATVSVSVAGEENRNSGIPSGEKSESSSPASISESVRGFFQRLGEPERKTVAVSLASSYDPNFNISSLLGSAAAIYDHGYLWDRVRSGSTAFKLEAVAGSMVRPEVRTVASVNMLGVYYPRLAVPGGFRPYLEAGIGAIYTDYRVDRQAYRFNFNPQAGIGTEIKGTGDTSYFVAMRLHHISNGSTNHDNRGVNSLLLQFGRFY